MREDDDKYELKKTLMELKNKENEQKQLIEKLYEELTQNIPVDNTSSRVARDKAMKIIKKLFSVYSNKAALQETIKERKEGGKEL